MTAATLPLQLLLLTVSGWVHRHQQDVIAYLVEENRVLKEELRGRKLRLIDDQRRRLAGHGETSAFVRRRVAEARRRQVERRRSGDAHLNAKLEGRVLECHCALDPTGLRMLDAASRRFHLTARSCHRLMKVARTIADLAGKEQIIAEHLAEAVQFRLEG